MPSLRQLLADHAPLLLIDASSSQIQVAEFGGNEPARWAISQEEAGVGVFRCLDTLAVDLDGIRAFVFCDGPGSVLGVRTVATAVRTWTTLAPRPVFAYHSLALLAHALGRADVSVISDARRDSWHRFRVGETLRRVPSSELTGPLIMPEGFRNWTPLPAGVESAAYKLAELWPRAMDADLLRATTAPDAFLHEEPSYVIWTPQVHRAP